MSQTFTTRKTAVGASIIAMMFAAACADSATRSEPLGPTSAGGPSFAILDPAPLGNNVPTGELFKVCKVYVGTAGPAVTITISEDLTANGVGEDNTGSTTLAGGECKNIALLGAAGGTITVTEAVPTGYTASWTKTVITGATTGAPTSGSGNVASGPVGGTPRQGTVVTFTNTEIVTPPTGGEGCTPGYWKQSQHFGSWTGYATTDLVNTVFGVTYVPTLNKNQTYDGTLLGAVSLGGGGYNALMRHAVAALLNSSSAGVDYEYTTAEVIAGVQAAFADPTLVATWHTNFATENERGCPLGRAELP